MNTNAPYYVFLAGAAIAIIDYSFYFSWAGFYYRNGVVLRRRFIRLDRTIDEIENQLDPHESSMVFCRLRPDTVAFREKCRSGWISKTPFIHGTILIEPQFKRIRVDMLANYFAIVFPVFFGGCSLIALPFPLGIFFAVFGVFVTIVLFHFSQSAYDELCRELEHISDPLATKAVDS